MEKSILLMNTLRMRMISKKIVRKIMKFRWDLSNNKIEKIKMVFNIRLWLKRIKLATSREILNLKTMKIRIKISQVKILIHIRIGKK